MSKNKTTKSTKVKVLEVYDSVSRSNYTICRVSGYKNPYVVMNPDKTVVLDDGNGWGFKSIDSASAMAKKQSQIAERYKTNKTRTPPKTTIRAYDPLQNFRIEYLGDEVSQMLSRRLKELKEQNQTENDTPPW